MHSGTQNVWVKIKFISKLINRQIQSCRLNVSVVTWMTCMKIHSKFNPILLSNYHMEFHLLAGIIHKTLFHICKRKVFTYWSIWNKSALKANISSNFTAISRFVFWITIKPRSCKRGWELIYVSCITCMAVTVFRLDISLKP